MPDHDHGGFVGFAGPGRVAQVPGVEQAANGPGRQQGNAHASQQSTDQALEAGKNKDFGDGIMFIERPLEFAAVASVRSAHEHGLPMQVTR